MTKANKKCFSLNGKEMTVDRRIRKYQKKQKDGEEIDVLTAVHLGQGHVEGTPS